MKLPISEIRDREWLAVPRNVIKATAGVYFLYDTEGTLMYIGWAAKVNNRIKAHINGKGYSKRFSEEIGRVEILPIENMKEAADAIRARLNLEPGKRFDIETALIVLFDPKYNKHNESLYEYTR